MHNKTIQSVLSRVRPAVRAQKPYLVGAPASVDVKLNQNENPWDVPEDIRKEILSRLKDIPFNRYPQEHPYALIDALSEKLQHPKAGFLVGNGSNELTHTIALSFIENGDPVLLPRPMFSLYTTVVHLFGGKLIEIPPTTNLHFDVEAILQSILENQPVLTVIATPNNPTGLSIPLNKLEPLFSAAQGIVLVDEAYVDFSEEKSPLNVLDAFPNVILMRTFSKAYGLAGLRLGYLMAHPDLIAELLKTRLPFMIDAFAETSALALLEHSKLLAQRIKNIKEETVSLRDALNKLPGVQTVPGQTNFIIFKTDQPADNIMQSLTTSGVLVRNMKGYPELQGYLRVSTGLPAENKVFLNALETALFA